MQLSSCLGCNTPSVQHFAAAAAAQGITSDRTCVPCVSPLHCSHCCAPLLVRNCLCPQLHQHHRTQTHAVSLCRQGCTPAVRIEDISEVLQFTSCCRSCKHPCDHHSCNTTALADAVADKAGCDRDQAPGAAGLVQQRTAVLVGVLVVQVSRLS